MLEFRNERDLLTEWSKFVQAVDPDMIIGYNSANFDLPYLLDRAKALKIPNFAYLGRLQGRCMDLPSLTDKASGRKYATRTFPPRRSGSVTRRL